MQIVFQSRYAIGDEVVVLNQYYGDVVAVRFTESKVTYDVALHIGGETLRDVDSTFVEPADEDFEEFRPLAPVFGPGGEAKLDPSVRTGSPLRGGAKPVDFDFFGQPFSTTGGPLRSLNDMLRDAGFNVVEPAAKYDPRLGRCNDPFCAACARTVPA